MLAFEPNVDIPFISIKRHTMQFLQEQREYISFIELAGLSTDGMFFRDPFFFFFTINLLR